jgi:plasmid stabilization system protein ParE
VVRIALDRHGCRLPSICRCVLRGDPAKPPKFPTDLQGVRRARIRGFPYIAYFVSTATSIQIVACMHAKRDPRLWQRRVDC